MSAKNMVFTWRDENDNDTLNKLFHEGWTIKEQVILPKRNARRVLFILEMEIK